MGYFPGKQTATPSKPKSGGSSGGGGGGSSSSSPTPYKTSPALDPSVNAARMKANLARGVGDSQGRSRSDPNYGKGPTAPSSQFRTGGGASLKSAKLKTRVVSRAEFQRSLAQKQQRSKAVRRFLKPLEEARRRTGAAERRKRIDALTTKQRLVKEIQGQPLSELGRREKQAIIDYIDRQFEPFIGRKKALFTPSAAGKIEKNLGIYMRKQGTKEITRKITPKEYAKKAPSTVTAVEKQKGLAGVRQTVRTAQLKNRYKVETSKSQLERTFRGTIAAAGLGVASGIVGVAELIRHPLKTAKAQIEAVRHPVETLRFYGEEFTVDPIGVVAEFYAFAKTMKLAGEGVKRSPAGRYVQEELFIRSQPKEVQGAVRKILRAARIQEKINPLKIKTLRSVSFLEVASINKVEAAALARALRKTDSVVFGSWAARTLGGKKLPKPKDVDIATADTAGFNRAFIKELPKEVRSNYKVQGGKIYRKVKSLKEATDKFGAKKIRGAIFDPIFDVKPLSRLIPQRSLFTGRGKIPVVGYVTKIKGIERIRKVLRISKQIEKLESRLKKATTKSAKSRLRGSIKRLEKQRKLELKKFSPSELAQLKKVPAVGGLEFPTQKVVKVKGIKLIGFGEQTVRKALGTLQVLIERSPRRAKDPAALLKALEVQRAALKASKKLSLFKRRKLKVLDDAIRMLKSKAFSKLLEKKVPGLTKEYPLVAKISTAKLKKVNFQKIREEALRTAKKARPTPTSKKERKVTAKTKARKASRAKKKQPSRLPKRRTRAKAKKEVSRLPKRKKVSQKRSKSVKSSRLPKRKRSSKLPASKLRRGPSSKLRSSKPSRIKGRRAKSSKLASKKPSQLKPSAVRPSKIQASKPSKLQPSKLRPSKFGPGRPSKLTASQVRSKLLRLPKGAPKPPQRLLRRPKTKKEEERVIRWVKEQKQIYRPSLAAVLFDITGIPPKRLTGFELRPIPVYRRVKKPVKRRVSKRKKPVKKKRKVLKRKTTSTRRKKK